MDLTPYACATRYLLNTLKGAQLAVALTILDKTLGWGKVTDIISYSQFRAVTRLSDETISIALQALMDAGIIARSPVGEMFSYWLTLPDFATSHISYPTSHIPQAADVDKPTLDSPHPVSPSTNSIPTTPPASPQTAPEPLGKSETHSLRYENRLKDKDAERKIGENWRMLLDINLEVIRQGCYPLANFRWLAERALELGFTDGFLWSVWEKCCAVADKPVALLLKILQGEAEIPALPRPKPAKRLRKGERDYWPHNQRSVGEAHLVALKWR